MLGSDNSSKPLSGHVLMLLLFCDKLCNLIDYWEHDCANIPTVNFLIWLIWKYGTIWFALLLILTLKTELHWHDFQKWPVCFRYLFMFSWRQGVSFIFHFLNILLFLVLKFFKVSQVRYSELSGAFVNRGHTLSRYSLSSSYLYSF